MLSRFERALLAGGAFPFTDKAFVINACGAVEDRMREMLAYTEEARAYLARPVLSGGLSVVGASGEVVAGPMGPEEGILYAEVDLPRCVEERTVHDLAGHYNRPDVFQLLVRSRPPHMVRWMDEEQGAPWAPAPGEREQEGTSSVREWSLT